MQISILRYDLQCGRNLLIFLRILHPPSFLRLLHRPYGVTCQETASLYLLLWDPPNTKTVTIKWIWNIKCNLLLLYWYQHSSPVIGCVVSNISQCAAAHQLSCKDSVIEMGACLLGSFKHFSFRNHTFSALFGIQERMGTAQNNEDRTRYVITRVITC
jgi:hypothetical protein